MESVPLRGASADGGAVDSLASAADWAAIDGSVGGGARGDMAASGVGCWTAAGPMSSAEPTPFVGFAPVATPLPVPQAAPTARPTRRRSTEEHV